MAGFKVLYSRFAFRTKVERSGIRLAALGTRIESVARSVTKNSHSQWVIEAEDSSALNSEAAVKLFVLVPAGTGQYDELLLALTRFEEAFEKSPLALPIDTGLRTITDDGLKCEDCGSGSIDWIRTTPYAGNERYFCDKHAQVRSDFGGNAATRPDNFMYVRQHPHRVNITT